MLETGRDTAAVVARYQVVLSDKKLFAVFCKSFKSWYDNAKRDLSRLKLSAMVRQETVERFNRAQRCVYECTGLVTEHDATRLGEALGMIMAAIEYGIGSPLFSDTAYELWRAKEGGSTGRYGQYDGSPRESILSSVDYTVKKLHDLESKTGVRHQVRTSFIAERLQKIAREKTGKISMDQLHLIHLLAEKFMDI